MTNDLIIAGKCPILVYKFQSVIISCYLNYYG